MGVSGGAGKYCFGCRVVAEQAVEEEMDDESPELRLLCRVGVSRGSDPVGALGDSGNSFGYGATGTFSSAGKVRDYGVENRVGDTVACTMDLDQGTVGFAWNGVLAGPRHGLS